MIITFDNCSVKPCDLGYNMNMKSLIPFTILSIGASIATISLKFIAFFLTGSVGLLSDAFESIVNLVASIMAFFMLKIAEKPADREHMYGHSKAEYFSSIVEGILILIAALSITVAAVNRILNPKNLDQISIGIFISIFASIINLVVGLVLIKNGKKHHSITLKADGQHLLTDVWTSAGVIIAIALVNITRWQILDPIVAIFVAINIVFTGYSLIKQSVSGFMDVALPKEENEMIEAILNKYCQKPLIFHGLLTRQSAMRRFVSFHLIVPDNWTVKKGHDLIEIIEKEIKKTLPHTHVISHIEPLHDKRSWED